MDHALRHLHEAEEDLPQMLVESFEVFYRREFPRMVDLAYSLSGSSWPVAEDLAQDALIAAYRDWARIAALDNPATWVRRVVLNRAASRFQRTKAEARALLRLAPLRHEHVDRIDPDARAFWEAVRALPTRQAQTIALHYLDELSIPEIAEVLGCSPNTIKVHLHRGRRELARRLELEAP